ncbi:type II toxin-antitoxin system RelE/ParE family toxin [Kingella denitrificans]
MRIFANRWFARFADKQNIGDDDLREAVSRAERGLIDADLGGGVIKQRIARKGQGKSGGFRSVVLFRQGERAFFVYAFAKSDRDNIDQNELSTYKTAAAVYLNYTDDELALFLKQGTLMEISHEIQK